MAGTRRSVRLTIEWAIVGWFFAANVAGWALLFLAGPDVGQAVIGGALVASAVGSMTVAGIVKVYRPTPSKRKQKKTKSRRGRGGT